METDFHSKLALVGSYKNSKLRSRVDWDNAWAQPKFDGVRALLHAGKLWCPGNKQVNLREEYDVDMEVVITIPGESAESVRRSVGKVQRSTTSRKLFFNRAKIYVCDIISDRPFVERWQELKPDITEGSNLVYADTIVVASPDDVAFCQYVFLRDGHSGVFVRHGIKPYQVYSYNCKVLDATCFVDEEFPVIDARKNFLICETVRNMPFEVEKPSHIVRASALIGSTILVRSRCDRNREGSVPTLPVMIGVTK